MDRLTSMRVFALAAQVGTLSGAARVLDMSPAMATKHVGALGSRLGVKLLHRTTRKLTLTEAGEDYLEATQRILNELDDADAAATSQRTTATGLLRMNTPLVYGLRYIAPLMPAFGRAHPAVTVELGMTDAAVNLVDERWDMAVRVGALHDDTLQARPLGDCRMVLCAAPSYLNEHGQPRTVAELANHNCLGYTLSASQSPSEWRFGAPTAACASPCEATCAPTAATPCAPPRWAAWAWSTSPASSSAPTSPGATCWPSPWTNRRTTWAASTPSGLPTGIPRRRCG